MASNEERWAFLNEWHGLLTYGSCNLIWRLSMAAIIWSFLLICNDIVFNNKRLEVNQVIDIIKLRVAFWVKAKWSHVPDSVSEFTRCPASIKIPRKIENFRPPSVWTCPPEVAVKFNVGWSFLFKPGLAGVGGILRNHLGCECIGFSKNTGQANSIEAEMKPVKEAFSLFLRSSLGQRSCVAN
ncbi:hypothetical protein PTKIN_Ptkin14bG0120500 [Pterospermum kingtungense]